MTQRLTPPRAVTRFHREAALDALIGADKWPSMPLACHYAATGEDSFDGKTLLVAPKPVAEALFDMESGGYHRGHLAAKEDLRAELAGAEERGRQRPWTPELASNMAALYEYMLDKSPRVDKFRVMFEVGQRLLVRTGTTPPDAGEPGNG